MLTRDLAAGGGPIASAIESEVAAAAAGALAGGDADLPGGAAGVGVGVAGLPAGVAVGLPAVATVGLPAGGAVREGSREMATGASGAPEVGGAAELPGAPDDSGESAVATESESGIAEGEDPPTGIPAPAIPAPAIPARESVRGAGAAALPTSPPEAE
jgi:hypothetical protein